MPLRSARLSGDPVLERCLAGAHRMEAPEENLSVMRVQEALRALGFAPGELDGIFGSTTGAAVSSYKQSRNLQPTDPVVGPGTSNGLDTELLTDPPGLDPDFGEVAPFVANHRLEPFAGFELAPLISAPLNSQRHDVGKFLRTALSSDLLLHLLAASRVGDIQDPRVPAGVQASLAGGLGTAAGVTAHFTGTDGLPHVIILLDDRTIRGRRVLTHQPSGRTVKVTLRSVLCHELTHLRNDGLGLENLPDFDTTTFLDAALASLMTTTTGTRTAHVFAQFAHEMNARHVTWIIEREEAGDPFAAQFLQPVALSEAAHFYFAETDPAFLFDDNGYIQTIRSRGHADTYNQIALWLRQVATMKSSDDAAAQQISAQLFLDAADSAEFTALNPALARPPGDGLFPRDQDFV